MAAAWHVIQSKPSQELKAALSITQDLEFPTYLPFFHGTRIRYGKKEDYQEPLFRSYLFAQFDCDVDNWGELRITKGVSSWIKDPLGRPKGLSDSIIASLRARDFDMREKALEPEKFKQGQTLKIVQGPFCGQTCTFDGDANKRVRVLMDLLGGKVPTEIDRNFVTAAA